MLELELELSAGISVEYHKNISPPYHLWWNNLWIIWSNHDIIIMVMIWWSSLKQPSPSPEHRIITGSHLAQLLSDLAEVGLLVVRPGSSMSSVTVSPIITRSIFFGDFQGWFMDDQLIDPPMNHPLIYTWFWWLNHPLRKIWLRQLGSWHSQYIWKNQKCSKPPTRS